ncbi:Rv3235 family protein [Streptomyces sp. NPDC057280]|uniref:Rv3235 family protein n=1 Tax=Streptomyces sp. NPDC057280 TaxID=3346081 RepID=UPI0036375CA8
MNKVMTRSQLRPGTRPPSRRDSRRPGGTPPRTPVGGTPRATPDDGRPPGSPNATTRTRPTDNRPPAATGSPTAVATPLTGTQPGTSVHTAPEPRAAAAAARPRTGTHTSAAPAPARTGTITSAPPAPTPRTPVPQLHPTDHIAELLVLVLSGQRPVHSMLRHTVGQAYDELAELAERGPLRARGTRPVVRDIGYYVPRPGAYEAFARIGAGDQLRAMAFRVELGRDRRWRCTAVELGGPRDRRTADH